jgi:hypothetical protein
MRVRCRPLRVSASERCGTVPGGAPDMTGNRGFQKTSIFFENTPVSQPIENAGYKYLWRPRPPRPDGGQTPRTGGAQRRCGHALPRQMPSAGGWYRTPELTTRVSPRASMSTLAEVRLAMVRASEPARRTSPRARDLGDGGKRRFLRPSGSPRFADERGSRVWIPLREAIALMAGLAGRSYVHGSDLSRGGKRRFLRPSG